jgi:hypothetical protein
LQKEAEHSVCASAPGIVQMLDFVYGEHSQTMNPGHACHGWNEIIHGPPAAAGVVPVIIGSQEIINSLEEGKAQAFDRGIERASQLQPDDLNAWQGPSAI